jgi:hypothetical protein
MTRGTILHRADPVGPVVAACEIPARPAEDRDAQAAGRIEDVLAKASFVAERRGLVEHAAVDAAAKMLDEPTEDTAIDLADRPLAIDPDRGHFSPLPSPRDSDRELDRRRSGAALRVRVQYVIHQRRRGPSARLDHADRRARERGASHTRLIVLEPGGRADDPSTPMLLRRGRRFTKGGK